MVARVIFLAERGAPRTTDQASWYHHVDAHFSSHGITSYPPPIAEQLFASHYLKDFSSLIGKPKQMMSEVSYTGIRHVKETVRSQSQRFTKLT